MLRVLIFIFLFVSLFSFAVQGQTAGARAEKREITGTVTDLFGMPWPGAKLTLRPIEITGKKGGQALPIRETATDSNGVYRFDNLAEGSYEITLLKMPKLGAMEDSVSTRILAEAKTYVYNFGVEIGWFDCRYFVAGKVQGEDGKPIVGATVTAILAFKQKRSFSETTDSTGTYSINVCSAGQYVVFSNTPGYLVRSGSVVFADPFNGLQMLDLSLKREIRSQ
jgi:hypothetical protein